MNIHKNYAMFEEQDITMKKHVDSIYNLVNDYAIKNDIQLNYNDDAERFVEAIATYIVESREK